MQKKAIAIAVAAALAAPMAASAQPTIYGKLHFSLDYVDRKPGNIVDFDFATGELVLTDFDDDAYDKTDFATGVSRASRLGFKGSENLGGDLKGIWQVETGINTGSDSVNLRNTFVGLAGSGWGSIIFGKHDTPYKMSTGKIDFWADSIADYNNVIGTISRPSILLDFGGPITAPTTVTVGFSGGSATIFDERLPQTVAYISPNWSGFSLAAAWASHVSSATGKNDTEDDQALSIMGVYDQGPFYASLAWEEQKGLNIRGVTGAGAIGAECGATLAAAFPAECATVADLGVPAVDDKVRAWKLGLAYRPKWGQVGVVYEDMSDKAEDSPASRRAWYANAEYKFGGNWAVKGAYGAANKSDFAKALDSDDSGQFYALGVDYNMSKRTTSYLIFSEANNKEIGAYGLWGPTSGDQLNDRYNAGLDGKVRSASLGVIHKF